MIGLDKSMGRRDAQLAALLNDLFIKDAVLALCLVRLSSGMLRGSD